MRVHVTVITANNIPSRISQVRRVDSTSKGTHEAYEAQIYTCVSNKITHAHVQVWTRRTICE